MNKLIKLIDESKHNLENKIKRLYPEEIPRINQVKAASFNERLYLYVRGLKEPPICKITSKPLRFINITKGYTVYAESTTWEQIQTYWFNQPSLELTEEERAYVSTFLPTKATSRFRHEPRLVELTMRSTKWIPLDHAFSERLYCIRNNINELPLTRFINGKAGYAKERQEDILEQLRQEDLKYAGLVGSTDPTWGRAIKEFMGRNRERNAQLYELPEDQENIQFVVCPVLGARTLNIKRKYVEGVLRMTMEQFKEKYPNQKLSCSGHGQRIRSGLHEIDEQTGKTKHQISVDKTKKVLSAIGKDGLTGYERKGRATRATHMANVDEQGRNGYSQLASKAIIVGNATKAKKGLITKAADLSAIKRYRSIVMTLTNRYKKKVTEGYNIGRAGQEGAYQLDHKYSIFDGFHNQISPLDIGHIDNFEMIPWEYNIQKWTSSSISVDALMKIVGKTVEESNEEFKAFMDIINDAINSKVPNSGALLLERFYESKLSGKS